MKHEQEFRDLCKSAFEFLLRSAGEVEDQPKYALIHFCIGLELVLKARLLTEHWSLVVTSKPELRKFKSGDFISVSPAVAMERIASILGESLPKEAQAAFEKIVQHRNQVAHFVHELDRPAKENLKQSVATDICVGWFHLSDRLSSWSDHFAEFKNNAWRMSHAMSRVRTYLHVVYEKRKPELDTHEAGGGTVLICPSCKLRSGMLTEVTSSLLFQRCLVCGVTVHLVRFPCANDECGIRHLVSGYDCFQPVQCACGQLNTQKDFRDYLDTGDYDPALAASKNCGECSSAGTVVRHDDYFVCVECCFFSDDAGVCEWCNELQLGGGSLEDSYAFGCEFCEGRRGYDADD